MRVIRRAARGGNPNIVSLLLSKGADAMARNRHGFTCIDLSGLDWSSILSSFTANPQVKAVFNMPPPVRRTAPGIGGSSGLDALAVRSDAHNCYRRHSVLAHPLIH